jgi:GT2 family glycosyltransferase
MVAQFPVTRDVGAWETTPVVTVVVCTYTERRWDSFVTAVSSLRAQRFPPDQCVVVVDHNDALLERVRAEFPLGVEVVPNDDVHGLAGARNTGVRWAIGEVVAFLDDDAEADPDWLATMLEQYRDRSVAGVGGVAEASWPEGVRPRWFPPEFDWVVGCSYRGLPDVVAPVRNPIGASMSLRRSLFHALGGFDTAMGRVGTTPLGCEETEFAVRARQHIAGIEFLHVPGAIVHHLVAPERARLRYFVRRCHAEGLSKAALSRRTGSDAALSSERRYTMVTLPRAVATAVGAAVKGDFMGLARAVMIVVGLSATTVGYVMSTARRSRGAASPDRHQA